MLYATLLLLGVSWANQSARALSYRGKFISVRYKHPVISSYPTTKYIIQSLGVHHWEQSLQLLAHGTKSYPQEEKVYVYYQCDQIKCTMYK